MRNYLTSRHGAARGFTLVELVVVLVIVSIMTAIAAPRYANATSRYRAEMAARKVAADLALAQSRARIQSAAQTVRFDTVAQSYTLPTMVDADHPASTYMVDLTQPPYRATVTLGLNSATAIVFNGYGMPDCGGRIVLQSGGATKVVTVDASTGGIQIQ